MGTGRIAAVIVVVWGAGCLAVAAAFFLNLHRIEPPERYIALGFGVIMLYMGGSMLAGLIWPAKPKEPEEPKEPIDPDAPIEVPPLEPVRERTLDRFDSVPIIIGVVFLAGSLGAIDEQPMVLVIAVIAAGVLAAGIVNIVRKIQGRHDDAPPEDAPDDAALDDDLEDDLDDEP